MDNLGDKRLRPSQVIAEQRKIIAQQDGIIETLKGALAAAGIEAPEGVGLHLPGLTPQERALVGALFGVYPRTLDKYELLELLPGHDHAADRQVQLVVVRVCHLRKKLGRSAVENVFGDGYRLGAEFHARLKASARS